MTPSTILMIPLNSCPVQGPIHAADTRIELLRSVSSLLQITYISTTLAMRKRTSLCRLYFKLLTPSVEHILVIGNIKKLSLILATNPCLLRAFLFLNDQWVSPTSMLPFFCRLNRFLFYVRISYVGISTSKGVRIIGRCNRKKLIILW